MADGALGLRRLPFSAGSRAPAGAGPDPHRRGAAAASTGWATGHCLTGLVSRLIINVMVAHAMCASQYPDGQAALLGQLRAAELVR
ncbi:hypothetical protein [Streptomyces sp. NPDC048825]|uniref:hypothetical protein n=1 Tax=Streptomyces sp. NPDC048825 TaxID=3365592 RepID=UPI003721B46B